KSFSRDFSDLPMVACFALFWRYVRRAAGGTQKILSARYSSGSSGSAPFSFVSSACFSSNESVMYFKKMRPRTTCLYSAASMLLRSLSAASQSLASKPRLAVEFREFFDPGRAICARTLLKTPADEKGRCVAGGGWGDGIKRRELGWVGLEPTTNPESFRGCS